MGNYTTLELEGVIGEYCRRRVEDLDDWLHQALIYNPDITPDYSCDRETAKFKLDDGQVISLPVYLGDPHVLFRTRGVSDIIGLGKSEKWNWTEPKWSYDKSAGVLQIHAYFRNYYNALPMFLDWLSPLVTSVTEGEFNTEDDLEGPRQVELINGVLTIAQYSFTR